MDSSPYRYIKCLECGNVTETTMLNVIPSGTVCKIDRDHYIVTSEGTGELHEYKRSAKKLDNVHSIRQSMARMRRVINANCKDVSKVRWCTLTYKDNMLDPAQLYNDFKTFSKRLRYHLKKYGDYSIEYIAVPEPQARGAWHMHVIYIFNKSPPYLDNNTVIAPLWGHGFTKWQAVNDVDNLGAYLSAYLSDIPVNEIDNVNELQEDIKSKDGHKYVKGARLALYPRDFKLYRVSRGIEQPKEVTFSSTISYTKYKLCRGEETYSYENKYDIDDEHTLMIKREYLNKVRKKS